MSASAGGAARGRAPCPCAATTASMTDDAVRRNDFNMEGLLTVSPGERSGNVRGRRREAVYRAWGHLVERVPVLTRLAETPHDSSLGRGSVSVPRSDPAGGATDRRGGDGLA